MQSSKISDYSDDKTTLKEELEKIQGATVNEVEEGIYTVERDENAYTVYEDGTIEEGKLDKWDGVTKEAPEVDGEGNWHIYTASQMKFFADYCNDALTEEEKTEANMPETTETTTVYLENNIDMGARHNDAGEKTEGENWTSMEAFGVIGTFEGNNHFITGIYIRNDSHMCGLFSMPCSLLQNLTIKDSYIEGGQDVGGITGYGLTSGRIINCHNINTTVKSTMDVSLVGGIVGAPQGGIIENCTNTGEILGKAYVGGIMGKVSAVGDASIENCINYGKVSGQEGIGGIMGSSSKVGVRTVEITNCGNFGEILSDNGTVGGIIGLLIGGSSIDNSYNKGNIVGKSNNDVGGVVGRLSTGATITNCYNTGKVVGETYNIGGVVGLSFGTIENSYNTGRIEAEGQVGGILGQIGTDCEGIIRNCYNEGEVIANTDAAGGIVGWTSQTGTTGTIEYNYNKGKVRGKNQIGGIIGKSAETFVVTKCYNVGEIIGETKLGSVIGEQLTNNDNLSNLFYWNGLSYKGVNGADIEDKKIKGVENKIESYEEFRNIIDSLT